MEAQISWLKIEFAEYHKLLLVLAADTPDFWYWLLLHKLLLGLLFRMLKMVPWFLPCLWVSYWYLLVQSPSFQTTEVLVSSHLLLNYLRKSETF